MPDLHKGILASLLDIESHWTKRGLKKLKAQWLVHRQETESACVWLPKLQISCMCDDPCIAKSKRYWNLHFMNSIADNMSLVCGLSALHNQIFCSLTLFCNEQCATSV